MQLLPFFKKKDDQKTNREGSEGTLEVYRKYETGEGEARGADCSLWRSTGA